MLAGSFEGLSREKSSGLHQKTVQTQVIISEGRDPWRGIVSDT